MTQEEFYVVFEPQDLMKLFASTLGVLIELFTVPVLSEPREYEAAEYWMYELRVGGCKKSCVFGK